MESLGVVTDGVATDNMESRGRFHWNRKTGVASDMENRGVATDIENGGVPTNMESRGVATNTDIRGVAIDVESRGVATEDTESRGRSRWHRKTGVVTDIDNRM